MRRRTFLIGIGGLAAAAAYGKNSKASTSGKPPVPRSAGHHPAAAPKPAPAAVIAVRYAVAQVGKPYVYGATGPDAFDCSGLVMTAYQSAGVSIPRTSEDQWAGLPHIPGDHLLPGDLVFFAGGDGTVTSPGHVVMYIGGGQVVQAYDTSYPVMTSRLGHPASGGLTGYARPATA